MKQGNIRNSKKKIDKTRNFFEAGKIDESFETLSSTYYSTPSVNLSSITTDETLESRSKQSVPQLRNDALKKEISFRLKTTRDSSIRSNKNVRDLTANKLRFANIGFYGRKSEISQLLKILARSSCNPVSKSSKSKEFVLLHGYSGVGKSVLASNFKEAVMMVETGAFVTGKFDLNNKRGPYQAISAAYRDTFWQLMKNAQENVAKEMAISIQSKILEQLGTSIKILAHLIPGLEEFLSQQFSVNSSTYYKYKIQDSKEENADPKTMNERLKFAFRILNRILTSHISPFVIVLDDIQWADDASINIIETLVSDDQNPNSLMILGMFRSNEVDESHSLSRTIRSLKEEQKSSNFFSITEIKLDNLAIDDVNKIIMALLSMDNELETYELAELCYRRTLGNPFFLIEFLKMLEEKEMLNFNLGKFRWVWDLDEIEEETASTENVIDLLNSKMKELPPPTRELLVYAACLGSTFRLKELNIILQHQKYEHLEDVPKLLRQIEEQLFIEPSSFEWNNFESGSALLTYRWVHDKVQEAALSLLEGKQEISRMHFEMGQALYHKLSKKEVGKISLFVANMVNFGLNNGQKSLDFAELNLLAAEKAKSVSSFQTAAKYACAGIEFLPPECWTTDRALVVQLHSTGAEMLSAIGEIEDSNRFCDFILSKRFSALEKVRVCKVKANSLASADRKYDESINVCRDVLKELDFPIPKSNVSIVSKAVAGVIRTSRETKNNSRTEASIVTDKRILAIMELLDRLYYYSYMSSNTMLFLLSLTQIIKLTNLHGICKQSPPALVVWGMIQGSILGKPKAGAQSAEKAMREQEKLSSQAVEAATVCRAHILVLPWSFSLHDSVKPLLDRAYKCGMQSGEVDTAMLAYAAGDVSIPLILGRKLRVIRDGCELGIAQAKQVKCFDNVLWFQLVLQAIENLEEQSNNTVLLKGRVIDEDKIDLSTPIDRVLLNHVKSFLYVICGEHKLGAELALVKGNEFSKASPGNVGSMYDACLRGVSLYAMALKTKKKKFEKGAKEVRKVLKRWLKDGNPNVRHYVYLFDAEQSVLEKKYDAAENFYRQGIRITTRAGYLHDSGIFHERYAEFLLNNLSKKDEAKVLRKKAVYFYKEWGATAKVKALTPEESIPSELFINA